MKNTIYILILILFLGAKSKKLHILENKAIELNYCKEVYNQNIDTLKKLEKELKLFRSAVYRIQLEVGIENPDSVFSQKEKIIYKDEMLKFK